MKFVLRVFVTIFVFFGLSAPVLAGLTVFKEGDKYVKIGGRIQLQYHQEDPEAGEVVDRIFFRRLRPYIEGSLHPDWKGKLQWELGGASDNNEVQVKDAHVKYTGLSFLNIVVGNANFPFSRELLTSSKKTQLIERSFTGDHNFGVPDKNLNINVDGKYFGKKLLIAAGLANASIDPDENKLDFDTPANKNADFNEGVMLGGRIEFQPLAPIKFSQGDFNKKLAIGFGVGAYSWANDNDNNANTDAVTGADIGDGKPDVDRATGIEVSASFRGYGFSADIQRNNFSAESTDSLYTGGLYEVGEAKFHNVSLEAGYMLIGRTLELAVGAQNQNADTYQEIWTRRSVGLNYFVEGNDIKIQSTLRRGRNLNGVRDNNKSEIFVQGQYVF